MAYEPKGDHKRALIFMAENYTYWKTCMQIHIKSYYKGVWEAIKNGPMVTYDVGGISMPKLKNIWDENDNKKWSCDQKAKNIILSELGVDEFYLISHYQTTKAMWETLQVAHEGTNKAKHAKINTLTQSLNSFE